MNRYKNLTLGIVRRWHATAASFVDAYCPPSLIDTGFVIAVVGPRRSGRTTLAYHIAKRLHEIGFRAPALIDGPQADYFYQSRYSDRESLMAQVWHRAMHSWAPVIITATMDLGPIESASPLVSAWSANELMAGCYTAWGTGNCRGVGMARLLKSRIVSPNNVPLKAVPALPEIRVEYSPYYVLGQAMLRELRRNPHV